MVTSYFMTTNYRDKTKKSNDFGFNIKNSQPFRLRPLHVLQAISAECYGLNAIETIPSGEASLGLIACSTIF